MGCVAAAGSRSIELGVPPRLAGLSVGGAQEFSTDTAHSASSTVLTQFSASYSLSGYCSQTACGHLPAASQQKSVAADQEEFLTVRHSEMG